jgi:hypothetical protein
LQDLALMSVASTLERGTVFVIDLPRAPLQEEEHLA